MPDLDGVEVARCTQNNVSSLKQKLEHNNKDLLRIQICFSSLLRYERSVVFSQISEKE